MSCEGFRGARPEYLANLKQFCSAPIQDLALTMSFRFGCNIGSLANMVLYAKENSPQIACFSPYRLCAGAVDPGVVTSKSLIDYGVTSGTILCRYGASQVEIGLGLLEKRGRECKIAILGPLKAESSGRERLRKVCKEVEMFLNVFLGIAKTIEGGLGFEGLDDLTWDKVCDMVMNEVSYRFSTPILLPIYVLLVR